MPATNPLHSTLSVPGSRPCSAIVLAGGRATRLGGQDKALVAFAGSPLIAHVLARLRPQVDDIVINCNRSQEQLAAFGLPLVPDTEPDFAGPLAGIAAALPHCRHEYVLVTPCDSPFLPRDLAAKLLAALDDGQKLAICHDGERLQPLFMLLHHSLLDSLRDYLASGQHKVEIWCQSQRPVIVGINTPSAFINLNTPEELAAAEKTEGDKDTPAF